MNNNRGNDLVNSFVKVINSGTCKIDRYGMPFLIYKAINHQYTIKLNTGTIISFHTHTSIAASIINSNLELFGLHYTSSDITIFSSTKLLSTPVSMSYLFRHSQYSINFNNYSESAILDYLYGAYAFKLIHRINIYNN